MKECSYCDESFEDETDLLVHQLEEHEDELNSHEKDEAKKAKRKKEEQIKQDRERKKRYLYQGTGVAVVLVLAAVLGPQLISSIAPSDTNGNITLDGQPMIGNTSAEVTVIEFGDFQCPACASFEGSVYPQIKSEYIDTGQVNFVWKDFPLERIHPWARTGAETMECVYRQDEEAFWSVKNTLFTNQNTLNQGNAQSQIIEWAGEEGVDTEAVRSCTQSQAPTQAVNQDLSEARSNQVTSTPTIFVNGQQVNNNPQSIQSAIEEELNN